MKGEKVMAMAKKRSIEKYQIKRMWVLAAKMHLTKDELYLVADVESLHDLRFDEADEVIARLSEMLDRREENAAKVRNAVTHGQKKKIWALMYELEKLDTEPANVKLGVRLVAIIQKELKLNATVKDPFVWMNYDKANKLVEVLKGYVKSAKKKKRGEAVE